MYLYVITVFIISQETKDWSLGKHPLTGLEGGGTSLSMLRKGFHSLLQTIANIMSKVCVCLCLYVSVHVSVHVSVFVFICVCLSVCIMVYLYVCVLI